MGRDNQPRERQAKSFQRKTGRKETYPRVLIVCEGETEAYYFDELKQNERIPSAHCFVTPSQIGTSPDKVVEYALDMFMKGVPGRLGKRVFDRIYVVFDRDDHEKFFTACEQAEAHNLKIQNDEKKKVIVRPIVSIPSFEMWILLHFEFKSGNIHRDEVNRRLKKCCSSYNKAKKGIYDLVKDETEKAVKHAEILRGHERQGHEYCKSACTDVDNLVLFLRNLKKR